MAGHYGHWLLRRPSDEDGQQRLADSMGFDRCGVSNRMGGGLIMRENVYSTMRGCWHFCKFCNIFRRALMNIYQDYQKYIYDLWGNEFSVFRVQLLLRAVCFLSASRLQDVRDCNNSVPGINDLYANLLGFPQMLVHKLYDGRKNLFLYILAFRIRLRSSRSIHSIQFFRSLRNEKKFCQTTALKMESA
jgi:hypothetical protein